MLDQMLEDWQEGQAEAVGPAPSGVCQVYRWATGVGAGLTGASPIESAPYWTEGTIFLSYSS